MSNSAFQSSIANLNVSLKISQDGSQIYAADGGATVVPGDPPSGVYAGNSAVTAQLTLAANHFVAIDSPATTGATTYKFQQRSSTGTTITTYNLHMIAMEIGA